jgi:beta-lactam-binding protein with PASTA domain
VVYAVDLLAERHLDLKTVDQQFDPKIPKDRILSQDPPPGTKTKKNHIVRIVVSRGAEAATIPDVLGKRWQEALNVLQQNKFRPGNVAYVHSADVPVDCIIAQTPPPRSESSAGGRVDLLVSLGAYKNVMVMPDLVEEQLDYAIQVIGKLGLVLGKIEHEQYPGVKLNTVLSQVPKPGTLIEEQNIVTFVVSGEPGGQETRLGGSASVQYEALEYTVPPGRFDREVRVLVKNAEGQSEMYRQFVPPGNRIVVQIPVVGETVVEIYLDGMLEQVTRLGSQNPSKGLQDSEAGNQEDL